MGRADRKSVVRALLDRHGHTFADELGIRVERNTPSELFRLLCAALLLSARIRQELAVQAARALRERGWTTARKMAAATWAERVRTLNRAGYARYDERTSRMLGDTSELLLERYRGDLRRLRDEAAHDPGRERELLKGLKGIGDVGADIFLREVQVAWQEVFPFADERALQAARPLGLPQESRALGRLVSRRDFPRLVAALLRVRLARDIEGTLEAARG
jgi:endonuclease III